MARVSDFQYVQFAWNGFCGQPKGEMDRVYCLLERSETFEEDGYFHSTTREAVISYNRDYGYLLDRVAGSADPAVVIKRRSMSYEDALEEWNRISVFPEAHNSVVWRETYNFQRNFEQLAL